MKQKIKLIIYSRIGISILFLIAFSCSKKEYLFTTKWKYINQTDYNISFSPDGWKEFNIKPKETIVYTITIESSEVIDESKFTPPINANILYFDTLKCDTLHRGAKPNLGDGPLGINNYQINKISDKNYEFIYTYKEIDFQNALFCK